MKNRTANINPSKPSALRSMVAGVYGTIKALVVPEKYNKQEGLYYWGEDNLLPQNTIKYISGSGTAKSCVSRIHDFVVADGFQTDGVGEFMVNPKQTADQLLNSIGWDVAYFRAFAVRVLFNLNGEVARIYRIPIKHLRVRADGKYEVNDKRGTSEYRKAENVVYDAYNPSLTPIERQRKIAEELQTFGEQRGQVLYIFDESIENENYSIPGYLAGLDDIISDGELQITEKSNIVDGFKVDAIIATVGVLNNTDKNDDGLTDKEVFTKNLGKFKGSRGAKMMHIEAESKDALPQVTPIDNRWSLDSVDKARVRVPRAVCRHFDVPPVLVGFENAEGLGNTQALINNMKLFNRQNLKSQNLITDGITPLFPDKDFTISTLNLIDFIPDKILDDLTPDERRALVGYDSISDGTTDEKLLSERLGVGGTQSLTSILADITLSEAQKLEVLRVLFGISDDDAYAMVYGIKKTATSEGGEA